MKRDLSLALEKIKVSVMGEKRSPIRLQHQDRVRVMGCDHAGGEMRSMVAT